MARNGVIGRGGGLPWKLSADLKRFKALTMGHHLVMGRKTYDSIGRILPGRITLVVSRCEHLPEGQVLDDKGSRPLWFVHSLDEALRVAADDGEVFVIGGGEIFELALPHAVRMYVTWVEAEVAGDITFPQVDWQQWREISSEKTPADARNEFDTTFCAYDRV